MHRVVKFLFVVYCMGTEKGMTLSWSRLVLNLMLQFNLSLFLERKCDLLFKINYKRQAFSVFKVSEETNLSTYWVARIPGLSLVCKTKKS